MECILLAIWSGPFHRGKRRLHGSQSASEEPGRDQEVQDVCQRKWRAEGCLEAPVGDRGCLGPSVSVAVVWVEVRGEGAGEGPLGYWFPPSVGSRLTEKAHQAPGGWAPPEGSWRSGWCAGTWVSNKFSSDAGSGPGTTPREQWL